MSIFRKKGGQISATSIPMTEAEAALAQSDFNIEKITEIQNKFTGGAVLLVPGRIFIREGLLWKVCRKGIKKRQFFLFNDILVYGSVVASRYSNQHSLALDKMSVSSECFYQPRVQSDFDADAESLDQQLDPANAFQISHADKSFHVFTSSSADKANWLANLNKHISRAAQLVADSPQQMMTRPVWVPDAVAKECMVCHTKFSTFLRKHHCRRCGRVVCSACSPHHVSLSTADLNVAGHAPHGEHGKLERVCKECFKEMTAQHNRSNSQSKDYRAPTSSSPAGLTLSTSERSTVVKSSDQDSTDTEDSDDSADEKSALEERLKVSFSGSEPVNHRSLNMQVSAKVVDEETEREMASSVPLTHEETEVQPTPPPRKKKLEKLLKKQIEAKEQSNKVQVRNDDSAGLDPNDGVRETAKEKDDYPADEAKEIDDDGREADKENEIDRTEEAEKDKDLSTPKKTRRKNKHSKPLSTSEAPLETPDGQENSLPKLSQAENETENSTDGRNENITQRNDEAASNNEQGTAGEETGELVATEHEAAAKGVDTENQDNLNELEQEQSPSTQKRSRGRRKKFKASAEKTDTNVDT